MTDDKNEALQRLKDSQQQSRTSETHADESTPARSLEDAVADAFRQLNAGEIHSNVSFRDEKFSALLHALEETDRLSEVVEAAAAELDRDLDDAQPGRSEACRLLTRVGLQTVASDIAEAGKDGYKQHQLDSADEF
jgi:predicted DNA-binding transcriptional regulator YafY